MSLFKVSMFANGCLPRCLKAAENLRSNKGARRALFGNLQTWNNESNSRHGVSARNRGLVLGRKQDQIMVTKQETVHIKHETVHIIDCNNGWLQAAYRISAVALPFSFLWFFSAPQFVIALTIILILCMSNRMQITSSIFVMPAWGFEGFPIASLKSITLESEDEAREPTHIVLTFQACDTRERSKESGSDVQIKRIAASRLEGQKSIRLLKLLDQYSPNFQIEPDVRRFMLGVRPPKKLDSSSKLEIRYHSLEQVKNFVELIKSYERYFWRVYSIVVALPFLCMIVFPCIAATSSWAGWFWLTLAAILGPTLGIGSFALGVFAFGYFQVLAHPITVYFGTIVSSALVLQFIGMLWQPNCLLLNESSLEMAKELNGLIFYRETFPWESFVRITLLKPPGTTAPEQWSIAFHGVTGPPLELKLSAIKGEKDRNAFLQGVEQWAPHLTRDHELIEALSPSQRKSYTELWLQALTTPPKRERLAPLSPGLVLNSGEYLITDQLGTGGQGIAYLAARSSDSEIIVVKEFVLPVFVEKIARRKSLEKFEHEAQLLRKLEHPQVVKLLDYFIEDHRAYLVLEHITGRSLRRIIDESGPMKDMDVCLLAEQMCNILQYLHGLEPPLVHRDFTPDNLILNEDGVLKLIDFNVAYRKHAHTTATVVGKHAYLPPEQFRGRPVPQSDIYAMGACLHFLLTGEDPEPVSVAHPILLCRSIDPKIEQIVERATALDTAERFASAAVMLTEFQQFREGRACTDAAENHLMELWTDEDLVAAQ